MTGSLYARYAGMRGHNTCERDVAESLCRERWRAGDAKWNVQADHVVCRRLVFQCGRIILTIAYIFAFDRRFYQIFFVDLQKRRYSCYYLLSAVDMYDIRRVMVWARRCRHSRGFGVQSPWAYSFIRYVVNEHYPYYAYKQLESEFKGLPGLERKLCRLYFRMANYLQPRCVVDFGGPSAPFRAYVSAGCRRALVAAGQGCDGPSGATCGGGAVDFARFTPSAGCRERYFAAAKRAGSGSMFVVEGIHSSSEGRRLWSEIRRDGSTGVTFDLYYCGIVCFDKERYRQNYIVNF